MRKQRWVVASGKTSDPAIWSEHRGGEPGASVPDLDTHVFIEDGPWTIYADNLSCYSLWIAGVDQPIPRFPALWLWINHHWGYHLWWLRWRLRSWVTARLRRLLPRPRFDVGDPLEEDD